MVEQRTLNPKVVGSNPSTPTNQICLKGLAMWYAIASFIIFVGAALYIFLSNKKFKNMLSRRSVAEKTAKEKREADRRQAEKEARERLSKLPPNTYELGIKVRRVCTPCRNRYLNEKILEMQNAILEFPWNKMQKTEDGFEKAIVVERWDLRGSNNDHRTDLLIAFWPTDCGHGYFIKVKMLQSYIEQRVLGTSKFDYYRNYVIPTMREERSEVLTSNIEEVKEEVARLASEIIIEMYK